MFERWFEVEKGVSDEQVKLPHVMKMEQPRFDAAMGSNVNEGVG